MIRPNVLARVLVVLISAVARQYTADAQSTITGDATKVESVRPDRAEASVPRLMRFSGQIPRATGEPLRGVVGLEFGIYKDREGGSPVWTEIQNVEPDEQGHFTAMLGTTKNEGVSPDLLGGGELRWLSVRVVGAEEQPRMLLVSVPYALRAEEAVRLAGSSASDFVRKQDLQKAVEETINRATKESAPASPKSGAKRDEAAAAPAASLGPTTFSGSTTTNIVLVQQTGTGKALVATATSGGAISAAGGSFGISGAGSKLGVIGSATAPLGVGVKGQSTDITNTSGADFGVQGIAANGTGAGVNGTNTATTGAAIGVLGSSSSPGGFGVQGSANAPGGSGVFGQNLATSGGATGVTGNSASPSGVGVQGNVNAPTGMAVAGVNNATSGFAPGVTGNTGSPSGVGISGFNGAVTGGGSGILGGAASPSGIGVQGAVTAPSGIGVFGTNTATSGTAQGVFGASSSPVGTGVLGFHNSVSGSGTGVIGQSLSPNGTGVVGSAPATSGPAIGVVGVTSSPSGIGVQGSSPTGGLAGQFNGNVQVNGNLSVTGSISGTADYVTVAQLFSGPNPTEVSCPAGYIAVCASCDTGVNVVINDQTSPLATGLSWKVWLIPSANAATGVHCGNLLSSQSATLLLRCSKN